MLDLMLFKIFINSLNWWVSCGTTSFAGDKRLFRLLGSRDHCKETIEINEQCDSKLNSLLINAKQCPFQGIIYIAYLLYKVII